jgi:hypothetical protein
MKMIGCLFPCLANTGNADEAMHFCSIIISSSLRYLSGSKYLLEMIRKGCIKCTFANAGAREMSQRLFFKVVSTRRVPS